MEPHIRARVQPPITSPCCHVNSCCHCHCHSRIHHRFHCYLPLATMDRAGYQPSRSRAPTKSKLQSNVDEQLFPKVKRERNHTIKVHFNFPERTLDIWRPRNQSYLSRAESLLLFSIANASLAEFFLLLKNWYTEMYDMVTKLCGRVQYDRYM